MAAMGVQGLNRKTAAKLGDGATVEAAEVEVERGVFDVISSRLLDDLDDLSQHAAVRRRRQTSLQFQ